MGELFDSEIPVRFRDDSYQTWFNIGVAAAHLRRLRMHREKSEITAQHPSNIQHQVTPNPSYLDQLIAATKASASVQTVNRPQEKLGGAEN